ncbi:glycosyltransferase family 4 protein [uncultured Thiohalocapsa sp.]|uniref:glycosyltransferase family 4 protein n=1 Tax=uncultured Thiohalocapsa sp. TaxID=768990 RepID=UPI0025EF4649|nr:glycosyltransferase family 4 protein [uncultured Thiohalocapsa sp.]
MLPSDAAPSQSQPGHGRARLHLLLPGSPAALTGGTLYDRRIAEGLRRLGWEVGLQALGAAFPLPSEQDLAAADAALAGLPPGALAVVDGLAFGAMPAVAARHADRLRLVALVHHPLALETGLDAAVAARLRAAETAALCQARRVVVTSAHTARLMADYGVPTGRLRVVEPGTDPAPLARGSVPRGMGPAPGAPLQLLCVGSVTPRKGHDLLVTALAGLDHLPWRLDCVGSLTREPATAAALRAHIQTLGLGARVRLLGEVAPTTLAECYQRADLFVLASWFEGYGMAYAEALARGLPVLGTTGGAVADTVPADAGLLVAPGSVAALRRALSRLLTDAALRGRLAAGAARARARLPDWPAAAACFAAAVADV